MIGKLMKFLRMILLRGYHARVAQIEQRASMRYMRGNVVAQMGRRLTKALLAERSALADQAMSRLVTKG